MFGCYQRLPPLHDVEFERRYNYGGALLWYAGFAPPLALRDGKLAFDYTYPDDWMKGAASAASAAQSGIWAAIRPSCPARPECCWI